VSLAQNFVASKIAEATLLHCIPDTASNPRLKGAVVIGNIEDDFHSLGRKTVGLFLAAAGWDVHDLGNVVPAEELLEKALEVNARVIGASAMMQTTALNIRKVRQLTDERGLAGRIKLAVGGDVFNLRPDLVAEVGGGVMRSALMSSLCAYRLRQTKVQHHKHLSASHEHLGRFSRRPSAGLCRVGGLRRQTDCYRSSYAV
jgi:methanogenic corrinoid protein MtbC1